MQSKRCFVLAYLDAGRLLKQVIDIMVPKAENEEKLREIELANNKQNIDDDVDDDDDGRP